LRVAETTNALPLDRRKTTENSQPDHSQKGAATQAVLMSVFRTLKLRGHDALKVIPQALRIHVATGTLPPLPGPAVADG